GPRRFFFVNGRRVLADGRVGRGKDKARTLVFTRGHEQVERAADVDRVVHDWVLDRVDHVGVRGQVHDAVDAAHCSVNHLRVANVAGDQFDVISGQRVGTAAAEVVQHPHAVACIEQHGHQTGADEACTAGDKDGCV